MGNEEWETPLDFVASMVTEIVIKLALVGAVTIAVGIPTAYVLAGLILAVKQIVLSALPVISELAVACGVIAAVAIVGALAAPRPTPRRLSLRDYLK